MCRLLDWLGLRAKLAEEVGRTFCSHWHEFLSERIHCDDRGTRLTLCLRLVLLGDSLAEEHLNFEVDLLAVNSALLEQRLVVAVSKELERVVLQSEVRVIVLVSLGSTSVD